jgi:hypothetical protein
MGPQRRPSRPSLTQQQQIQPSSSSSSSSPSVSVPVSVSGHTQPVLVSDPNTRAASVPALQVNTESVAPVHESRTNEILHPYHGNRLNVPQLVSQHTESVHQHQQHQHSVPTHSSHVRIHTGDDNAIHDHHHGHDYTVSHPQCQSLTAATAIAATIPEQLGSSRAQDGSPPGPTLADSSIMQVETSNADRWEHHQSIALPDPHFEPTTHVPEQQPVTTHLLEYDGEMYGELYFLHSLSLYSESTDNNVFLAQYATLVDPRLCVVLDRKLSWQLGVKKPAKLAEKLERNGYRILRAISSLPNLWNSDSKAYTLNNRIFIPLSDCINAMITTTSTRRYSRDTQLRFQHHFRHHVLYWIMKGELNLTSTQVVPVGYVRGWFGSVAKHLTQTPKLPISKTVTAESDGDNKTTEDSRTKPSSSLTSTTQPPSRIVAAAAAVVSTQAVSDQQHNHFGKQQKASANSESDSNGNGSSVTGASKPQSGGSESAAAMRLADCRPAIILMEAILSNTISNSHVAGNEEALRLRGIECVSRTTAPARATCVLPTLLHDTPITPILLADSFSLPVMGVSRLKYRQCVNEHSDEFKKITARRLNARQRLAANAAVTPGVLPVLHSLQTKQTEQSISKQPKAKRRSPKSRRQLKKKSVKGAIKSNTKPKTAAKKRSKSTAAARKKKAASAVKLKRKRNVMADAEKLSMNTSATKPSDHVPGPTIPSAADPPVLGHGPHLLGYGAELPLLNLPSQDSLESLPQRYTPVPVATGSNHGSNPPHNRPALGPLTSPSAVSRRSHFEASIGISPAHVSRFDMLSPSASGVSTSMRVPLTPSMHGSTTLSHHRSDNHEGLNPHDNVPSHHHFNMLSPSATVTVLKNRRKSGDIVSHFHAHAAAIAAAEVKTPVATQAHPSGPAAKRRRVSRVHPSDSSTGISSSDCDYVREGILAMAATNGAKLLFTYSALVSLLRDTGANSVNPSTSAHVVDEISARWSSLDADSKRVLQLQQESMSEQSQMQTTQQVLHWLSGTKGNASDASDASDTSDISANAARSSLVESDHNSAATPAHLLWNLPGSQHPHHRVSIDEAQSAHSSGSVNNNHGRSMSPSHARTPSMALQHDTPMRTDGHSSHSSRGGLAPPLTPMSQMLHGGHGLHQDPDTLLMPDPLSLEPPHIDESSNDASLHRGLSSHPMS